MLDVEITFAVDPDQYGLDGGLDFAVESVMLALADGHEVLLMSSQRRVAGGLERLRFVMLDVPGQPSAFGLFRWAWQGVTGKLLCDLDHSDLSVKALA